MENTLNQVLLIAALTERTLQAVKELYAKLPDEIEKYVNIGLSLLFAVIGCWAFRIDLLGAVGLAIPGFVWVGYVVTGVVAAFGSNILHILVAALSDWRETIRYP